MKKLALKIDPEKKWEQLPNGDWCIGFSVPNLKNYLAEHQSNTISIKNLLLQIKGKERFQQNQVQEIILGALVAEVLEKNVKSLFTTKRRD